MTIIRPAKKDECVIIAALIKFYAQKEMLLFKGPKTILESLPNFFVASTVAEEIVGCCGYRIWADESVEIVSLAVREESQGQGVGRNLVRSCVYAARAKGFEKFFTLTVAPELFRQLGFRKIDPKTLYVKVWNDCLNCPRNAAGPGDINCNETAMSLVV